jgi:hemerythrin-like metal-binding protein
MEWNQSYSVRIEEIDLQHKKLIGMLDHLIKASDEHNAKSVIKEILDNLVDYTVYHFNSEERYFDKFGYQHAAEHKAEHKQFVDKVAVFVNDYNEDKVLLSADIMMFLSNWVQNHIKGSDQLYSACFLEHGLGKPVSKQGERYRSNTPDTKKKASKETEFSAILVVLVILAMIVVSTLGYLVL